MLFCLCLPSDPPCLHSSGYAYGLKSSYNKVKYHAPVDLTVFSLVSWIGNTNWVKLFDMFVRYIN